MDSRLLMAELARMLQSVRGSIDSMSERIEFGELSLARLEQDVAGLLREVTALLPAPRDQSPFVTDQQLDRFESQLDAGERRLAGQVGAAHTVTAVVQAMSSASAMSAASRAIASPGQQLPASAPQGRSAGSAAAAPPSGFPRPGSGAARARPPGTNGRGGGQCVVTNPEVSTVCRFAL